MSFEESYEQKSKNKVLQRVYVNEEGELHLLFSGTYPSWSIFSKEETELIKKEL